MKRLLFLTVLTLASLSPSFAGAPVNDTCPVCGKNARLIYRSDYKGEHIIFCTAECKDKFDKAPGKYKVTPKKD
jgi:YHS domain-containing protein